VLLLICGAMCVACCLAPRIVRLRAVALQLTLALMLCFFSTALPLLMELAKARNGGSAPFHTPSMVFYTEVVKLVVSLVVYGVQLPSLSYTGLENIKSRSTFAYALPALMYALQNNLNYYSLQLIDPPTYQLWGCAKLIFAGLFFRLILGRRLTPRKWVALTLLAVGMAVTTLKDEGEGSTQRERKSAFGGIALVLGTSALSGWSSVFNEWLIKYQDVRAPLMYKNLMLYLFGAVITFGSWKPGAPVGDTGVFVALVLAQSIAGLCVSFVLKYCDSLVKGFSTSGAVLLAMLASAALFNFQLHGAFALGTGIVCVAFYLYFVQPPI